MREDGGDSAGGWSGGWGWCVDAEGGEAGDGGGSLGGGGTGCGEGKGSAQVFYLYFLIFFNYYF